MDFLVQHNRAVAGDDVLERLSAEEKHVIVLGGGDTGSDCIGTAHRQGAASVTNLAIGVRPPEARPAHQPWPVHPTIFEVQSSHEESGSREYLVSTVEFVGEQGRVRALRVADTEIVDGERRPKPGTEREIPADLVLLAMGFTGAEPEAAAALGTDTGHGSLSRDASYATASDGVFVAGDAGRGASLIVWAITQKGAPSRHSVDRYLTGSTILPSPVNADARPLIV